MTGDRRAARLARSTATLAPREGPPGHISLVDAGFVVFGILVAISALDDTFDSRSYLFVAAIAAITPVAAAAVISGSSRPWSLYVLTVVLIYPVGGAIFALGNHEFAGLPSPSSLLEVLSATWSAPERLLTTLPPVRATGEVLVLPYLISYAASAIASRLAATQRPVAPVVPIVIGLAVAVVFGGQRSDWLVARTAAFTGLILAWIAIRAARTDRAPGAGHARWLRTSVALVVVALVAGGLTYRLVPQTDVGSRVVLRGQVGRGQDVSGVDNPLSNIRKYRPHRVDGLPSLAEVPLLKVTGLPPGRALRFATLDVYDGVRWRADNRTVAGTSEDLFQRVSDRIAPMHPGKRAAVQVDVLPGYASAWLPLAGELTAVDFVFADGRAQVDDVRYNPATAAGIVLGGLAAKDDYDFTAVLPQQRLSRTMKPFGGSGRLQPKGAGLDPFLKRWRKLPGSKLDRLFALAEHLVIEGRYSDGARGEERFTSGQDLERLSWNFIATNNPVGNDEQYAAFVALAASRLGIPARVVVGAVPKGRKIVRGRDVQAWVEIQIADGSWRVLPNEAFMSRQPATPINTGRPTPEQIAALERAGREPSQASDDSTSGPSAGSSDSDRRDDTGSVKVNLPGWSWLVLLVLVAVVLPPGAKWLRRRRRTGRGSPEARVIGWWQEIVDASADLGRPVPPWLSRPEQARSLCVGAEVAAAADEAAFAKPHSGGSERFLDSSIALQAGAAIKALRAASGWRARLLAPWRLASWRSRPPGLPTTHAHRPARSDPRDLADQTVADHPHELLEQSR